MMKVGSKNKMKKVTGTTTSSAVVTEQSSKLKSPFELNSKLFEFRRLTRSPRCLKKPLKFFSASRFETNFQMKKKMFHFGSEKISCPVFCWEIFVAADSIVRLASLNNRHSGKKEMLNACFYFKNK